MQIDGFNNHMTQEVETGAKRKQNGIIIVWREKLQYAKNHQSWWLRCVVVKLCKIF